MRWFFAIALICLSLAWMPRMVLATDPAIEALQDNVAVAFDPPQSSAEALLTLPSVYVLPGSWLYWFKQQYEALRLILASNPKDRSALLLQFSQERLAEGYQLMQKGDWQGSVKVFESYRQQQGQLEDQLLDLQAKGIEIDSLLQQLSEQLGRQKAIDQFGRHSAPDEHKEEISQLLQIDSRQTLALVQSENGALLGVSVTQPQSTMSATPSATPIEKKEP